MCDGLCCEMQVSGVLNSKWKMDRVPELGECECGMDYVVKYKF